MKKRKRKREYITITCAKCKAEHQLGYPKKVKADGLELRCTCDNLIVVT